MHVAALSPPGRLPTVTYDPGEWWSHLVASGIRPEFFTANLAWWRTLFSTAGARLISAAMHRRWRWRAHPDLCLAAEAAGQGLEAFRRLETYSSGERYVSAVTPFGDYLGLLNRAQDELWFHVDFGVRILQLDYGDSGELVAYARRDTVLARLIAAAIRPMPPIDLLVVSVSRPEELLTALVAVRLLKASMPALHACLADHGHENFTLAPHLDRLRPSGTLDSIFDTIIESKDERDEIVPRVADALASRRAPRGYLAGNAQRRPRAANQDFTAPSPAQTFCSEPIMWTRISPRRCFWDRCTFCALNAKYSDPKVPSAADIPHALDRLEAFVRAGYRIINFGDEALSPALIERICEGIQARNLDMRWACCCKLEACYSPGLFALMRQAGCYEIFWGLESISPRLLRLMDKEVHGLDQDGVRRILDQANEAGIGLHVSLMAGFPGDTPADAGASVEFVIEALRDATNATFNLNRFMLLDGSPIMADPERYGVIPQPTPGDMPFRHAYRLTPDIARDGALVDRQVPRLLRRLYEGLGWDRFGSGSGSDTALDLHFFFGHGSIFKQSVDHPFANPLRQPAGVA